MTNTHPTQHSQKGRYFGYARASTPKQGFGVSLLTQREAIEQFAAKRGFFIIGWFEEKETAARRGRPLFGDWADLGTRISTSPHADGLGYDLRLAGS